MNKLLNPADWENCIYCNNTGNEWGCRKQRVRKCKCRKNPNSIFNQSRLAYKYYEMWEGLKMKYLDNRGECLNARDQKNTELWSMLVRNMQQLEKE